MVLFAIIKSILTNSWQWSLKDEKSPLGIIKNTLIAGVLIQASWFLMAALIDVSTIATYAVGGLPLNVLKDNDIANTRILTVNSELDLDKFDIATAGGKGFKVWYTTDYGEPKQKLKVSPCRVEQSYIIGRENGDPEFRNVEKISVTNDQRFKWKEVCVLFGKLFVLRDEDKVISDIKASPINTIITNTWSYTSGANAESAYNNIMKSMLTYNSWAWTGLNITGNMVHVRNSSGYINTWKAFFDATSGVTLANIIKESKGFVGPLVTLYSSLLNFAQLSDTEIGSIWATSGIFLIKTWVALALFFPLLALAVVLIVRIGYLWLFIVASPFIIIKSIFSNFLKLGEKLDGYLSIKTVVGIVFAPVITVAALSLSLIFMSVLTNRLSPTDPTVQTKFDESFNISRIESTNNNEGDTFDFLGIAQFQFSKLARWETMDRFSWLLINFFAIALLWMIVFAAIKSNKLGEKIWWGIETFWSYVFQTVPILPVPWLGGNVWVQSMAKVLGDAPSKKLQAMQQADSELVNDWFYKDKDKDKDKDKESSKTTITPDTAKTIVAGLGWLSNTPTATDKTEAEKIFTGQWITDIWSNITTNEKIYYDAIKDMKDDADKQNKAITWIEIITWNDKRYESMVTKEKQTDLDAITSTSKDINVLKSIFDTPWTNQGAIDAYFTAAKASGTAAYEVKIADNNTYTVTKKEDPTTKVISYDVVQKTNTPTS